MNYSQACQQMGYAVFKKAGEPQAKRWIEAVNFMAEHATDANWAAIERSLKILEEGYKNKEPNPYTKKLVEITNRVAKEMWERDMIYYSICYDGFRL